MNTRPATPPDALLLSRLSMDVQRLHAEHHPGIFKMPLSEDYAVPFFEEMLVDPNVHIFVAETDGQPAGYIVCKLIERPENPFTTAARTLLVDQISVRPEARGQGIGAALLWQADLLARELNVQRIHLDSWDFNLNAHKFFEGQGYQKFMFRFWKQL
ncbi:MAG: N-acetyltransferase family protein [Syntrophothermus sp.]